MKSIWKFRIPVEVGTFILSMPKGAKILTFQTQGEKAYIWAVVSVSAHDEKRIFRITRTGLGLEKTPNEYIGTIQTDEGKFVWHLFEMK